VRKGDDIFLLKLCYLSFQAFRTGGKWNLGPVAKAQFELNLKMQKHCWTSTNIFWGRKRY